MDDVGSEVARRLAQGRRPEHIRAELVEQGFSAEDVDDALAQRVSRSEHDARNSRLLSVRETLDRIGYGTATPQFVNILFWLSQQGHPYIIMIIGLLGGIRTLLSVTVSSVLQEYCKLHRPERRTIAGAGVCFGFMFLLIAFSLLVKSILLFSAALLLGTVAVVIYGDLYQQFVHETIRRERMGAALRTVASWGILVTAASLVLAGYLLEAFPMTGVPVSFELFGMHADLRVYGYLLAFQITAFAFILGGYVTSLVADRQEKTEQSLRRFLPEHLRSLRARLPVFWKNRLILLLTLAGIISGLAQLLIASYSGIAIYRVLAGRSEAPFLVLALIYALAIVASLAGPYFTRKVHRSIGLAPTLVFGTLLIAILPLVLVYNPTVVAIALALCLHVIGGAITGFGTGLLAQKLMDGETRKSYFQAQWVIIVPPYLLLVPLLAWLANSVPLSTTFMVAAAGLIAVVMPLYFVLVYFGQHERL